MIPLIPFEGINETPCPDKLIPLIPLIPATGTPPAPDWLPDLLAIREVNPGQPPSVYANELMAKHQIPTDGRTVKALLKQHDALVELAK